MRAYILKRVLHEIGDATLLNIEVRDGVTYTGVIAVLHYDGGVAISDSGTIDYIDADDIVSVTRHGQS